jgi:hypothetical protein
MAPMKTTCFTSLRRLKPVNLRQQECKQEKQHQLWRQQQQQQHSRIVGMAFHHGC